ncbi:MAG: hypothetical protein ACLKAN_11145 [Alkaliphilus sp.]
MPANSWAANANTVPTGLGGGMCVANGNILLDVVSAGLRHINYKI